MLAVLAALTVGAWALTLHQAGSMAMPAGVPVVPGGGDAMAGTAGMAGMGERAGMAGAGRSPAGLAAFLVAWGAMMAAMMFPAAAPMLLLVHRVAAGRRAAGAAFVPTCVFAAGYLLVWTAVGAVAWAATLLAGGLAGRLEEGARARWAPVALGAVLVVAGLYQLTPLKRACLAHCRTPAGFVMGHWRDGRLGALRMGVVHGGFCLGCCWALFAVLAAAGMMSLAWMLLLTLVVFAEKVLPGGERTARAVGAAFVLLGVLVAVGAAGMPWVTRA